MAIENGQVADADEVVGVFATDLKNYSNLLLNQDLVGYHADTHEGFLNLTLDNFKTDTIGAGATNFIYTGSGGGKKSYSTIFGLNESNMSTYDDFTGTLDNWDVTITGTAAVTIVSNQMDLTAEEVGNAKSRSVDDLFDGSFGGYWLIGVTENSGNTSGHVRTIRLTDGTNNHTIKTLTGVSNTTGTIILEKVGNTVYTKYGSDSFLNVDVSSWTSVKIEFEVDAPFGSGSAAVIKVDFLKYRANANTHTLISPTHTAPATITNAILISNVSLDADHDIVYQLSADNGSNYENVTLNQIHRFTNTGTQLKLKIIVTSDNTQQNQDQETLIYNYLTRYNLY